MKDFYFLKRIRILLLFIVSFPAYCATYYVTENGAGSRNGSSWANALAGINLQGLINFASAGDQIWVACGTYKPTTGTDRNLSFSMKNGVSIYGGFIGTETLVTERSVSCGPCTILSGEIGVAGIADNSYKVIYNQGLNNTAILDGFVIRDGNDDRTPTSAGNGLGGGLYNHGYNGGSCSPTVRNCIFTNNRASWGAGVFNNAYNNGVSSPFYTNCVFYQNHAYIEAGGMDSYGVYGGTISPTLTNCIFHSNTSATNVGAMYVWGGNGGVARPRLINCIFANNTALNGYGGAFISDNIDENQTTSSGVSVVTLQNCIVWNNSATGAGPQFYRKGTGSQVIAINSTINLTGQTNNQALDASSSEVLNSDPLFQNGSNPMGVDNCWFTSDDGLQLQSNSTSLNSGLNANAPLFDILGNPRSTAQQVDRGAYESQSGLGISEVGLHSKLYCYPNPFESLLNIKVTNDNEKKLKVIDILGKDISKNITTIVLDSNTIQLEFKQLPSGVYFIKVEDSYQKVVKR